MANNRIPQEEKRKKYIFVRVTDAEHDLIEAVRGDEPAAAFARRVTLEKARGQ